MVIVVFVIAAAAVILEEMKLLNINYLSLITKAMH